MLWLKVAGALLWFWSQFGDSAAVGVGPPAGPAPRREQEEGSESVFPGSNFCVPDPQEGCGHSQCPLRLRKGSDLRCGLLDLLVRDEPC